MQGLFRLLAICCVICAAWSGEWPVCDRSKAALPVVELAAPNKPKLLADDKVQICVDALLEADKEDGNFIPDLKKNFINVNVKTDKGKLFKNDLPANILQKEVYKTYQALMYRPDGTDMFKLVGGVGKTLDAAQNTAVTNFLKAIQDTKVMQTLYGKLATGKFAGKCLLVRDKVFSGINEIGKLTPFVEHGAAKIWFHKNSQADASAFQHVFFGEIKNGKPQGLHDLIRVYAAERKDGAQKLVVTNFKEELPGLATVTYTWDDSLSTATKSSSVLVGPSPVFLFALATLVHFVKADKSIDLKIDSQPMSIASYTKCWDKIQRVSNVFPCKQGNCSIN